MKFIEAAALQAPSGEQIDRAQKIIEICKRWCVARETAAHGLQEHLLPQANWSQDAPNAIYSLYEKVANGDSDTLRLFRFYTQPFSGFDLGEWRRPVGKTVVRSEAEILSSCIQGTAELKTGSRIRHKQITAGLPERWIIQTPQVPGEIGWLSDGRIINPDTLRYQQQFQNLLESGFLPDPDENGAGIAEIGAGYGGLAYFILSAFPNVRYSIIDLPESVLFSALYLGMAFPRLKMAFEGVDDAATIKQANIVFCPNFIFPESVTASGKYNLVINIGSFAEMSENQVDAYGKWASGHLLRLEEKAIGALYEVNVEHPLHGSKKSVREILKKHFSRRRRVVPLSSLDQESRWQYYWTEKNVHFHIIDRQKTRAAAVKLEADPRAVSKSASHTLWQFRDQYVAYMGDSPFDLIKTTAFERGRLVRDERLLISSDRDDIEHLIQRALKRQRRTLPRRALNHLVGRDRSARLRAILRDWLCV